MCLRLTVQAVCKVARDEGQVRETLDALWRDPERTWEIMRELRAENEDLYRLEELLEAGGGAPRGTGGR